MTDIDDMKGTLKALLIQYPDIINDLETETYEDFIEQIYEELNPTLDEYKKNPELSINHTEDEITIGIVRCLKAAFRKNGAFEIGHELKIGGHADLCVQHKQKRFIWIAEAKIYYGCNELCKGLRQLVTRYSVGDENNREGALLIYIKKDITTISVIEKLQTHLNNDCLVLDNSPKLKPAFYSTQRHPRSGLDFKIRHIPVSLQFYPKDRKLKKT